MIIKNVFILTIGEMAERLKAHAWKACKRETVSRVRIPFSPPLSSLFKFVFLSLSDYSEYLSDFNEKNFNKHKNYVLTGVTILINYKLNIK